MNASLKVSSFLQVYNRVKYFCIIQLYILSHYVSQYIARNYLGISNLHKVSFNEYFAVCYDKSILQIAWRIQRILYKECLLGPSWRRVYISLVHLGQTQVEMIQYTSRLIYELGFILKLYHLREIISFILWSEVTCLSLSFLEP